MKNCAMNNPKKIAIIVQRYGAQVNGGAEVHARLLAEQLAKKYTITVLTSLALEYRTWKPEYQPGESYENEVKIIRFKNKIRGNKKEQNYYSSKARGKHLSHQIYRLISKPSWWLTLFPGAEISEQDYLKWLQVQGPYMPDLIDYLREKKDEYDTFIFFTALYFPTAAGIFIAPEKSILIPTMHDEKVSYMPGYHQVMKAPAWILFNTNAEQKFCEKLFLIEKNKKSIAGVGIDLLKEILQPDESFLDKYKIKKPFLVYVGRIDKNKGCNELIKFFVRFTKETRLQLNLVMIGKRIINIKASSSVIFTDYIDNEYKNQILLQAHALVIPSFYESLSLVLLESFSCAIPVIANGNTKVLKEHIDKSGGGWNYCNYRSFKKSVAELLADEKGRIEKGDNGYKYVVENYSWKKVTAIFDEAIDDISNK